MTMGCWGLINGWKPVGGMVLVQVTFAWLNILYKLAINDGMKVEVIVVYRYLFATAFLSPIAFFLERKKQPKLTLRILLDAFFCGLFGGSLVQNFYIVSIGLTSPTFAAAMFNVVPPVTFILAAVFGLERLGLKTKSGQAKVTGTLVCVGGAMVLTFYKGPGIHLWPSTADLLKDSSMSMARPHSRGDQIMGSLFAVGSLLSYSLWFVIQAKTSKNYPCLYSSTALMCIMASVQSIVYALCVGRNDWEAWRLGFDVRLLSVAYAGVVTSGLVLILLAWCIKKKGPLFASAFNPLMPVIVAILASFLLDEKLHVGIILGTLLIVVGLYVVLWGKGMEATKAGELPMITMSDSTGVGSARVRNPEDPKPVPASMSNVSVSKRADDTDGTPVR